MLAFQRNKATLVHEGCKSESDKVIEWGLLVWAVYVLIVNLDGIVNAWSSEAPAT